MEIPENVSDILENEAANADDLSADQKMAMLSVPTWRRKNKDQ